MAEDMEKRVAQYIALRDTIEKLNKEHEETMRPHKLMLERIGGMLQQFMDANNLENLKTAAGTCYISIRHTASVQDADAFMKFVIEQQQFDLLERRASSTAVRAYVEDHNSLPAGVSLNTLASVGVRRPTGKTKS
jgi:hypothetical protein